MTCQGNESPHEEICGALLGKKNGKEIIIEDYIPLTNVSDNKLVHYIPDPNEWFQVLQKTTLDKDSEISLVGIYHTHPQSPPIASTTDIEEAGYAGIYIIYSPRYKKANTYYYDGDEDKRQFTKTNLKIEV